MEPKRDKDARLALILLVILIPIYAGYTYWIWSQREDHPQLTLARITADGTLEASYSEAKHEPKQLSLFLLPQSLWGQMELADAHTRNQHSFKLDPEGDLLLDGGLCKRVKIIRLPSDKLWFLRRGEMNKKLVDGGQVRHQINEYVLSGHKLDNSLASEIRQGAILAGVIDETGYVSLCTAIAPWG